MRSRDHEAAEERPRKRQVTPEHSSFRRVAVFVPLRLRWGSRPLGLRDAAGAAVDQRNTRKPWHEEKPRGTGPRRP